MIGIVSVLIPTARGPEGWNGKARSVEPFCSSSLDALIRVAQDIRKLGKPSNCPNVFSVTGQEEVVRNSAVGADDPRNLPVGNCSIGPFVPCLRGDVICIGGAKDMANVKASSPLKFLEIKSGVVC